MTGMRRKTLRVFALVLLFFLVMFARSLWSSRLLVAEAEEALASADYDRAIVFARQARRWYFPGNLYAHQGERILVRIIEKDIKPATTLSAQRSLEASIMATRSLWNMTTDEADAHVSPTIQRDSLLWANPRVLAVGLLIVVAFWGWIFLMFRLVRQGFDADGNRQSKAFFLNLSGAIALFGILLAAMAFLR